MRQVILEVPDITTAHHVPPVKHARVSFSGYTFLTATGTFDFQSLADFVVAGWLFKTTPVFHPLQNFTVLLNNVFAI